MAVLSRAFLKGGTEFALRFVIVSWASDNARLSACIPWDGLEQRLRREECSGNDQEGDSGHSCGCGGVITLAMAKLTTWRCLELLV